MKVGYEVKIDNDIWECISGGTNIVVLQKKVNLEKPSPLVYVPKNKREDVYYLEFINKNDIPELFKYLKENKIKNKDVYIYYILTHYCNLRVTDIADKLNVAKSTVSRASSYILNNGKKDYTDDLARTIGYWKYKQLNNE